MDGGRPDVRAVPNEPREGHSAISFFALPSISVHHWETLAKYMNAGESTVLEHPAAALRFQEGETEQHHH